jgi:hypothetical protein
MASLVFPFNTLSMCADAMNMYTYIPWRPVAFVSCQREPGQIGCSWPQQPVIRAPLHTGSSLAHLDTLIFPLSGQAEVLKLCQQAVLLLLCCTS